MMRNHKVITGAAVVVASLWMLTGCAGQSGSTAPTNTTSGASNTAAGGAAGSGANNATGAGNESATGDPINATTADPVAGLHGSKLVQQLKTLAQAGKVDNCPFVAGHSTIAQVKQQWNSPDTQTAAGPGTYATYNARHNAFGFNAQGTIFDVRSYSAAVQSLTLNDVHSALGSPAKTTEPQSGQVNDIYQVNATYQLQFIVDTESNRVNHVSVFDASAVSPSHTAAPGPTVQAPSIRGIVEGFYGLPWTDSQRLNMFSFMEQEHLNTYVYAPKDDPYQRVDWRQQYPSSKLSQMKSLVTGAKGDGIAFVYSISPGMTGTSTTLMNDSITYSSSADRRALEAKIGQLESIGVSTFMLSFDDIVTQLKPADAKVYASNYAKAQMQLANAVYADEKGKYANFQLWFVPTSYYGLIDGPYWQTLRGTLNSHIQVIWTGRSVLNKTITTSQAETITQMLGRKPILWDNYPVNDYTYVGTRNHQLMLGPLEGRDATLPSHLAGYLSNPMLQPAASKLALETIADYLQHPAVYQPQAAWESAISEMPGVESTRLFQTFATFNTASILDLAGNAPTPSLMTAYWNATTATQKQDAEQQLQTEFSTLAGLPHSLPPNISDKELLQEIQPWLTLLGEEGQGGLDALNVLKNPNASNKSALENQLRTVTASHYEVGGGIIDFMKRAAGT